MSRSCRRAERSQLTAIDGWPGGCAGRKASRESEARAAGDARTKLAGSLAALRARWKKEWGRVEAAEPSQIWQSDMTKIWAGPAVGWAYLVGVIDCCTREIVGWNLSNRCRTEEALAAVEQAVLERLPAGSRQTTLTLTTDNGTQFTSSRFMETLAQLGITHRRTAYHHPQGNSYIERFHRSLKEEEVWTSEYRNLPEARESIGRYVQEYNQDRPHRGIGNRTPHEAFLAFAVLTKNETLKV
jgi:putative transposase